MSQANKIRKYERGALEAMKKPTLCELAREERETGAKIGALSRAKSEIITDLLKIKITPPKPVADVADVVVAAPRIERTKLEPPSVLQSKPDRSVFRLWLQEVTLWRGTHSMHSDASLVTTLLRSLGNAEKSMVFAAHNAENPITTSSLLAVLELPYKGSEQAERQQKLTLFRKCVRGGRKLQEFLGDWELLRGTCVMNGTISRTMGEQDKWDLLASAELSTEQGASILHDLSVRAELRVELGLSTMTPSEEFETTKKLLAELSLYQEFESGSKTSKKPSGSSELTAMFAKGKAAGKGKTQNSFQASGKGDDWKKTATCFECGKVGHVAADCWQKIAKGGKSAFFSKGSSKGGKKGAKAKSGGKGKSKPGVVCYQCGKPGHMKADCWSKPAESGGGGAEPPNKA